VKLIHSVQEKCYSQSRECGSHCKAQGRPNGRILGDPTSSTNGSDVAEKIGFFSIRPTLKSLIT
jgi:hypothetical protein